MYFADFISLYKISPFSHAVNRNMGPGKNPNFGLSETSPMSFNSGKGLYSGSGTSPAMSVNYSGKGFHSGKGKMMSTGGGTKGIMSSSG